MAKKCTGCDRLDTEPLGLNKNGEPYLSCCPDSNYKEITAVDWFIEKAFAEKFLWVTDKPEMVELNSIIEQAKQMEKEQKMKFAADFFRWWWSQKGTNTNEAVDQYYNETFGGKI